MCRRESCSAIRSESHHQLASYGRSLPQIVAVLGATGVGKSRLAMNLARRVDAEVISADSRQVYRHLDIGTAKPSIEERTLVTHHVVDVVDPDQRFSVVDFVREASIALDGIVSKGRVALIVGGTGYYARALLDGMNFPKSDEQTSDSLEPEVQAMGMERAMGEIRSIDPETADRLDSSNMRRVARALALIRSTGHPIPPATRTPLPALILGLSHERGSLYARLDQRVDDQIRAGLVDETRAVLAMGFSPQLPTLQGLAYGQVTRYVSGEWTLDQARQAYKNATHALVRRQDTWFRREPRITWIDALDNVEERAEAMVAKYLGRAQI